MKTLIIGDRKRYEKFYPATAFADAAEKVYVPMATPVGSYPAEALDADFLAADAVAKVPAALIERMPNLKIIHSEGVGYNGIDVAAAAERGIFVCNNQGINATAVAEQTVLLMLGLLRTVLAGHEAVMRGEQIRRKEALMLQGITELGDCRVGLLGFGDIAKETARVLHAFGAEVFYHATRRKSAELEAQYHARWMELDEMKKTCRIISVHVPVTPDTTGMIDEPFLRGMQSDAYLINTARGEIVDNDALVRALNEGWIAGAGLDTIAPEPVSVDHPLLHLSGEAQGRLLLSPHMGGITTSTFRRGHRNIWAAFEAVSRGERPAHIVNGI